MAFGTFDSNEESPMAEMNVIPLVDIMLVLLVIFIITAPVITHAIKINIPEANSETNQTDARTTVLSIDAQNRIMLNDSILPLEQLESQLTAIAGAKPQHALHLHADSDARYDTIAKVMASARRAGIARIGFVTSPEHRQ